MALRGPELSRSLEDACRVLLALADSCFGPYGRPKLVVIDRDDNEVELSSASDAVLGPLSLANPLAAMVLRGTGLAQGGDWGDGGWASLRLTSLVVLGGLGFTHAADRLRYIREVQRTAQLCSSLLSPPTPDSPASLIHALPPNTTPTNTIQKLKTSNGGDGEEIDEIISAPLALQLDLSDTASLLALLRAVIFPRRLPEMSDSDVSLLSVIVAQAFLATLAPDCRLGASGVRTVTWPGAPISHSRCLPGVLLNMDLLPLDMAESLLPLPPSRVALFIETMDLPPAALAALPDGTDLGAVRDKYFTRLVGFLSARSVSLVLCQKVIHPSLRHLLRRRSILFLERLSITTAAPAARLTGAQGLAGLIPGPGWERSLGRLTAVSRHRVGPKEYLLLENEGEAIGLEAESKGVPGRTIVCAAGSDVAAREVERVVGGAVKVLYRAVAEPWVVPGGGATESLLAARIRSLPPISPPNRRQSPTPEAAARECFAGALESWALSLGPGARTLTDSLRTAESVGAPLLLSDRVRQTLDRVYRTENSHTEGELSVPDEGGRAGTTPSTSEPQPGNRPRAAAATAAAQRRDVRQTLAPAEHWEKGGGTSMGMPVGRQVTFFGYVASADGPLGARSFGADEDDDSDNDSDRPPVGCGPVCSAVFRQLDEEEEGEEGAVAGEGSAGFGWVCVPGPAVLDLAGCKRMAIMRAAEMASTVLRCCGVLPGVERPGGGD